MDATTSDPTPGATTIAVVLAGGGGTRFDGPTHKLDADLGGIAIADRAVGAAHAAEVGPVVVVVGAHRPALTTLTDQVDDGSIAIITNPDWAAGQATSLQCGIAEAERRGADAIVVGLADQPFVEPAAWRAVAASSSPIAVAEYPDGPRNPVRLHRSIWSLLPHDGDRGARDLIRLRPELVERVPCSGSPADIDTQSDLRAWQARTSRCRARGRPPTSTP